MGNIEISDSHLIFLATPYQTNSLKPISANGIHSAELSPPVQHMLQKREMFYCNAGMLAYLEIQILHRPCICAF